VTKFWVEDSLDCERMEFGTLDKAREIAKSWADDVAGDEYYGESVTISIEVPLEQYNIIEPEPVKPKIVCERVTVKICTVE